MSETGRHERVDPDVVEHYRVAADEVNRFCSGAGRLEYERSKEILASTMRTLAS